MTETETEQKAESGQEVVEDSGGCRSCILAAQELHMKEPYLQLCFARLETLSLKERSLKGCEACL